MTSYDAVVIGSGPNGLAAAIVMARAGRKVVVYEAKATIGGGMRTQELTLPGYRHDVCSAIHPLAAGTPFMRSLPLDQYGLEWLSPPSELAHPLDDGTAAMLERTVAATADGLGVDRQAYTRLMSPLVAAWDDLADDLLGPLRLPRHIVGRCPFRPVGTATRAYPRPPLLQKRPRPRPFRRDERPCDPAPHATANRRLRLDPRRVRA